MSMTIYDIAKLAGVSASTVSRAMNGKPGVSEEKRQQINEILRQQNYAPDENARNLVTQTTHTIGILTDNIGSKRQDQGKATIESELMRNGYYCFATYVGSGPDAIVKGAAELARRRVEGALLLGASFRNCAALEEAISMYLPDVPVVLVHQTERIHRRNVYCIGASEQKGFFRCVNKMHARGRKNVALLIDAHRVSEELIRTSFEAAVKECAGMNGWVYTNVEPSFTGGGREVARILAEHPNLDGLVCAQDAIAIGAMYALEDRGIRVPEDVSIIGEDNSDLCEACRPRLSSLDTMLGVSTFMSARLLLDVLNGREQTHKITLEMEIVERETT